MTSSSRKIEISKIISPDLALRMVADSFFDKLEIFPEKNLIIDFSGVKSITRSFADEYDIRKMQSQKEIVEVNMPTKIRKMFDIVKKRHTKSTLPDLELKKAVFLIT